MLSDTIYTDTQQIPTLLLSNVSRIFGSPDNSVRAVNEVSLKIYHGQFIALVGRSGSGKTTLMNIMSGLDKPTSGSVYYDGTDLGSMKEYELVHLRRTQLGFIFQSFGLISLLSAYENVQLPLHISGVSWRERRRRATEALDMVGLANRSGHRPYELSGGEQQRVAIARALVTRPSILFADEPTGELDSVTATSISTILQNISKQNGVTVVIATHDPILSNMCDMTFRMADGYLTK
ncbi:MAG: ABC transporter ATP-binding protein [Chloroflexota bacterium]|nr:ABC transporter ATP-binding protein [Chloroflexota bacterium]